MWEEYGLPGRCCESPNCPILRKNGYLPALAANEENNNHTAATPPQQTKLNGVPLIPTVLPFEYHNSMQQPPLPANGKYYIPTEAASILCSIKVPRDTPGEYKSNQVRASYRKYMLENKFVGSNGSNCSDRTLQRICKMYTEKKSLPSDWNKCGRTSEMETVLSISNQMRGKK